MEGGEREREEKEHNKLCHLALMVLEKREERRLVKIQKR